MDLGILEKADFKPRLRSQKWSRAPPSNLRKLQDLGAKSSSATVKSTFPTAFRVLCSNVAVAPGKRYQNGGAGSPRFYTLVWTAETHEL